MSDGLDLAAIRARARMVTEAAPVVYRWTATDAMGVLIEQDIPALVDELEQLRTERENVRAIAADFGEHPTATSKADGCPCTACEKFPR